MYCKCKYVVARGHREKITHRKKVFRNTQHNNGNATNAWQVKIEHKTIPEVVLMVGNWEVKTGHKTKRFLFLVVWIEFQMKDGDSCFWFLFKKSQGVSKHGHRPSINGRRLFVDTPLGAPFLEPCWEKYRLPAINVTVCQYRCPVSLKLKSQGIKKT